MYSQLIRTQALIDGVWCDSVTGKSVTVKDPGSNETIATVPDMGAVETARAIAAAQTAFISWRTTTAAHRAALLRKLFELMQTNLDALAELLTREQGKPLAEARDEILYAASFLEWFAEEGKRAYGEISPASKIDRRTLVLKQPVGVVAAITPWNFPAAMITRKLAPALAAGCTVVLKPASQTPLSALAIGALALEAGIPPGVFNIVTGSAAAIGGELTRNPTVRKLSFTGSTEIGRHLYRQSADTVKKLSLELGGNAPFIVFDDADIDAAVEGAIQSKFRNAGQTCVCTNRFYVQSGVYDLFAQKFAARVKDLKVGYGLDRDSTVGPLIDKAGVAKVEEHLADAINGGARILSGGKRSTLGGTYFEPTVVADVKPTMKIASEETFGPLAGLIRFDDESEALRLANETEFGLASYFYAGNINRVWRVLEGLEAGMIGVNTGLISTETAPFGGIKQSGLGREGSRHGLDDYLELKYVCLKLT